MSTPGTKSRQSPERFLKRRPSFFRTTSSSQHSYRSFLSASGEELAMNLFNILATRPSIITSQRICHSLEKNIWIFRVCLIIFALTTTSCSARVAETIITDDSNTRLVLYVDTSGNDKWSGLLPDVTDDGQDGPFATIGRAIVTIRKMKAQQGIPKAGIVVEFASGRYQLDKTLEFTLLDSGTTESPIIYRARPGADVRLSGSIPISDWLKVTDETIINRLDKQSRANVFMADLKKSACSNIKASIGDRYQLYYKDEPMIPARWPNDGFTYIFE